MSPGAPAPADHAHGPTALSGGRWRDADRDRLGTDPDAQCLASRARAAIEREAALPVEPDPEPLPLRDLGEGRLIWVPESEPAERAGPLDRIAPSPLLAQGGRHPVAPAGRPRLRRVSCQRSR